MTDLLYRDFLECFADAFFMLDGEGRILDVNAQACARLGYTREELLRLHLRNIAVDYAQAPTIQRWADMAPNSNYVTAGHHYHRSGRSIPVEVTVSCQLVGDRKHYFTLARDMSEKLARVDEINKLNTELAQLLQARTRQWQDSARLLNSVMRGTSDIVFVKDLQGRYVFANPAADRVAQVAEGGSIGKTDAELIGSKHNFADDDALALQSADPVVATSYSVVNGQKRIFHSIKSQYRDEQGQVIGLLCIARDITHIQQAQQQLRMSYDSLRRAERLSRIGSWTLELATGEFRASDMMYEMNGVAVDGPQITPEDLGKMMPPDDHARVVAAITLCAQTGQAYDLDVMHFAPGRAPFPATIRGQADRDDEGQIVSVSGTVQDMSEREDAKLRLETLANNLPNGAIYRLETDGGQLRLSYISAGIEQLVGVSAITIMADRAAYLATIHPDDRPAYDQALRYSMQHVKVFDHSFRIVTPGGVQRWLRCRSAPSRHGPSTVWDGILLDITPEREAQQALQQAKDLAESAERAKADFLATMSHEIRTPMNTVIGMTRLMQQTPLTPKQGNYMEKVDIAANALLAIINDILDFSKIEAGMLALESVEFSLDDILATVSAVTTLRAEEKGLEMVYSVAPDVPRLLRGDPLRLSQVLNNLVSNAIKFTEHGEVVVAIGLDNTVHPSSAPAAKKMLKFSVRDTGIGLSPTQIQQIFHPFQQADSLTTRRYGGTGLGLSICQRLVELMDGEIHVTSQPGAGSSFEFTAALLSAQPSAAARRTLFATDHNERVLIVDDNASARDILCRMVRGFGMQADSAASGEQALRMLHSASCGLTPYGLVLMDWRMPGMDGLEVARRIRQEESLCTTPAILMVSAYGHEEVPRSAEALGLQGLLVKPVTESVLFNAMVEALPGPSRHPALNTRTTAHHGPRRPAPLAHYAELAGHTVLVVDDNALNREVAAEFLALVGIHVHLAHDGQEAVQLLQKVQVDAVLMDVHMPVMDGLQATRAIRNTPALHKLPVIALTAQTRPEDRILIEAAGMNAHLTKPIDEQQLYAALQMWIKPTAGEAAAVARTVAPSVPFAQMQQRFRGNRERIARVLQGFYRDFASAPAQLQSQWQEQRWADLAMLTHTLKGALGYLDTPALAQQAQVLEDCARQLASTPSPMARQTLAGVMPGFADQLTALLAQIATYVGAPAQGAEDTAPQLHATYFEHLQALIREGDYAAVGQLELLRPLLAHPAAQKAHQAVQQYVEDLDTAHALEALQRLRALLAPVLSAPSA